MVPKHNHTVISNSKRACYIVCLNACLFHVRSHNADLDLLFSFSLAKQRIFLFVLLENQYLIAHICLHIFTYSQHTTGAILAGEKEDKFVGSSADSSHHMHTHTRTHQQTHIHVRAYYIGKKFVMNQIE